MKATLWIALFAMVLATGPGCSSPSVDSEIVKSRSGVERRPRIAGLLDPRFNTDQAMLASAELLRTAEPFYRRFEELGWDDDVSIDQREMLLDTGPAFSRYNIDQLFLLSGLGVPLIESPHFNPSLNRRLLLRAGIEEYPIANTRPIYLEYVSGDPHFTQPPVYDNPEEGIALDGNTLMWNPDRFDREIEPGTLAASLLAQTLWSRRFLASGAGADDEDDPTGPDDEDDGSITIPLAEEEAPRDTSAKERYLGLQFAEIAANKIIALATRLAWDPAEGRLGGFPDRYEPGGPQGSPFVYFPHRVYEKKHYQPIEPEDTPVDELPTGPFFVRDSTSYLRDQALLLEALLVFCEFSDPSRFRTVLPLYPPIDGGRVEQRPVFTARVPLMARSLATALVRNILGMHYRPKQGSLVSYARPGEVGKVLEVADAGYAMVALERFVNEPWVDDALRVEVKRAMRKQGAFLLKYQYKDGAFADRIKTSNGDSSEPHGFALTSQMGGIRALLAAYRVGGDFHLHKAAWRNYQMLEKILWAPAQSLYRVEDLVAMGQKHNALTPEIVASVTAGLRELALETRDFSVVIRLTDFLVGVEQSGLLLSELEPTGENYGEEWDYDEDNIRKPPFAGGRFGIAPVFASEVLIYIPSTGEIIPLLTE